jgi:hypothetical protein
MTGWLPEPVTSAFPDAPAPPLAEPLPVPLPVEPDEPPTGLATITGDSFPIPSQAEPVPEPVPAAPEVPAPVDQAAPAGLEAAADGTGPRDVEAALPEPGTMAPEADMIVPEADTAAVEAKTGAVEAETAAATEADTGPNQAQSSATAAETGPNQAESVTSGFVAALDPAAATDATSEAELPAAVIPPPVAVLPGRPRRRPTRPLVLGTAAAVILIGSVATGLGLSGSSHPSASHGQGHTPAAAAAVLPGTSTSAQTASSQPSPSLAKSSPHSSAASSKRPSAQPTTQNAITQTQSTAPGSVASSTKSTPKSSPKPSRKPTPKPTPKQTQPAVLHVSASGAGEDSCGAIGSLRSSSGASVQYTFVNNSSASVAIASIDSSGAESWQSTISPGAEFSASANVGQYWVVQKSGGSCLAVLDIDGGGQATIT